MVWPLGHALTWCGPQGSKPGVSKLADFKKRTLFYRPQSYRDYEAALTLHLV